MSYSNTPKLYEIVLDYTPELTISSFSPPVVEIDANTIISVVGLSLNRVTAVSWNGLPLAFSVISAESMSVMTNNLTMEGGYPLYFQSPTANIYSSSDLTVYVSQFGVPPTLSQCLRLGKFLSRLGFIKYPSR